MEYGSVVFDLDVLLVSGGGDRRGAAREALSELGVEGDYGEEVLDAVLGDEGYEECVRVCGEIGVDPRRAWSVVAEKSSQALMESVEREGLVYGAESVLHELRQNQVKIAVVSDRPDQAVEMVVDHFDLRGYVKFFRGVQSFEDLNERKPHQNYLELARFQSKREPYLYVGDSGSDLKAVEGVEMDSAWIEDRGSGADHSISSLRQVPELVK